MKEKDIIYIKNTYGQKIPFEAVTVYNLEKSKYNYIIYRDLEQKDYYIAKYLGDDIADLDTNLTEEELDIGNKILKGVLK